MIRSISEFITENTDEMYRTLKELCAIPAPSHFEKKRAEYCKKWLESAGAKGVYTDSALNVILPINCDGKSTITVIAAHTDTVFPDTEPMPVIDDGEKIHSPGAGDDTAQLVVMLFCAKFFIQNNVVPSDGLMFVCNSCEEGLGNLKGTRQIFKDFEGRIKQFVSFDSNFSSIADTCVGSHRYEVSVSSKGGHSYGNFGRENAIARLSKIINMIYAIDVPKIKESKTTYNVGVVSGGTSVNTIAQNASMLCEYRSDNRECLDIMQKKFAEIFESAKDGECSVKVTMVGERPCGNTEQNKLEYLKEVCKRNIEETVGCKVHFSSSSTDCNIPLSLGIPALCMGVIISGGAHTREEWVDKASMPKGLEVAIKTVMELALLS